MQQKSGLTVRRFSRHELQLDARVSVAGSCLSQVRLSGSSGTDDGWASATLIDAGEGGLGLATGVFFPRRCILHVRVSDPGGGVEPLLATDVRVQRVTMLGAGDGYALGTAFVERGPALAASVQKILALVEAACGGRGASGVSS